ncbi:MAG: 23S rRNA (guanosine(2251)-2'-O)-methyltransferase RlmB [Bacilli bacterium]
MLVYGKNVASEILKKNEKVRKIFLQDNFNDKNIISLIEKNKIPVFYKSKYELDKLADSHHQGIILFIDDFVYCNLEEFINKDDAVVLILDHIEDPHNLGAMIRTCEAAGVDGIILPKNRSVEVNATVMKTSAGALSNIKIASVTNLKNTIDKLKKNGFWIIGTDMVDSVDYRKIDYSGKIALVIGSEGFGMSRIVRESCDFVANIPMYGKVNSLNASVACGIMVYEIINNHRKQG